MDLYSASNGLLLWSPDGVPLTIRANERLSLPHYESWRNHRDVPKQKPKPREQHRSSFFSLGIRSYAPKEI